MYIIRSVPMRDVCVPQSPLDDGDHFLKMVLCLMVVALVYLITDDDFVSVEVPELG